MNTTYTYQPHILEETCRGLECYDLRDEMLNNRELELTGPVDTDSVSVLIRSLLYLQKKDSKSPITLYINSPGGEVSSGLALYDTMQAVTCPIRTVCVGSAASMAAILFIAGNQRDMLPHSRVMIHDPLIQGNGITGNALNVYSKAEDLMRVRKITAEIIARHTGMDIEKVFTLTAHDTYFEAEEAVKAGLADHIIHSF